MNCIYFHLCEFLSARMAFGEQGFFEMCEMVCWDFASRKYSYRQLACLTSYFWERITSEYKQYWKTAAVQHNLHHNLAGRRKIRGFWLFAKELRYCIKKSYHIVFYNIWMNLTEEQRDIWNRSSSVIEFQSIIDSMAELYL